MVSVGVIHCLVVELMQSTFYQTDELADTATPSKKRAARNEMRTLKNVLGRIMNILDKKPSLNEVIECRTILVTCIMVSSEMLLQHD